MADANEGDTATASQAATAPVDGAKGESLFSKIRKVAFWVLLGVAGFALNEGLSWARDMAMDKPDYLKQLSEQQTVQFEQIRNSLGELSSSLRSGDREAYEQIRGAVAAIEHTNASLIEQLALAKQENETLRKVGARAGVSGGYDFILAEDSGIRIDPGTIFGLSSVSGTGTVVHITSSDAGQARRQFLRPGQSVAFRNDQGADCKISLLSFKRGKIGTGSYAVGCKG